MAPASAVANHALQDCMARPGEVRASSFVSQVVSPSKSEHKPVGIDTTLL